LAASTLVAALALAPGIAHAAKWLKPVPMNLAPASHPAVGLDANGNTIAAWETDPGSGFKSIQAARHGAGLTSFTALTDFSDSPTFDNFGPVIAMNGAGNGIVAWVHDFGVMGNQEVELRTVTAGGVTGPVQPVSSSAGGFANIAIAIDGSGDAVVAWIHGANTVEAITRQGTNGTFTSAATLDNMGASGEAPEVAIDGNGNALAAWTTNNHTIEAKRHPAGGSWTVNPDTLFTAGHTFTDLCLGANATGQVVIAFQDTVTGEQPAISEASGSVTGGFGTNPTIKTLSDTGVSHGPDVAVDSQGGAIVGWTAAKTARFSRRPPNGSFPAPAGAQSITPVPVTPNNFVLFGNAAGEVIASWYSFEMPPGHNVVRAAVKPAGATAFGASQVISDPTRDTYDSPMALDSNGDAVAGLPLGSSGSPLGVEAVVFDGAPPRLGTLTGPSSLLEGAKASFSVPTPTDAFSAVSPVKWSFGDGSAGSTGLAVSHTFTRAGRFTVKATATDAAGNAATKSLVVTVKAKTQCIVPKLKGKTLSQAKTLLTRAHCTLGQVHKPKHHKRKLVVSKTSPGAGQVRPAGTKVAVTLKPKSP
jgi:hypothetical protein